MNNTTIFREDDPVDAFEKLIEVLVIKNHSAINLNSFRGDF